MKVVEIDSTTETFADREDKLSIDCKHKNIVDVFYTKVIKPKLYIVMEYCRAGSLSQYVKENSIKFRRCVSIMEDVTAAVEFLHNEKKVYHRDITPANVLISDASVAKLADFGLAKVYVNVSYSVDDGSAVGTRYWKPPEMSQRNRRYGFTVDVFPLGLLFHAMIILLPNKGNLVPITGEYPGT